MTKLPEELCKLREEFLTSEDYKTSESVYNAGAEAMRTLMAREHGELQAEMDKLVEALSKIANSPEITSWGIVSDARKALASYRAWVSAKTSTESNENHTEFRIGGHCKGNYLYMAGDNINGVKTFCTCGAVINIVKPKEGQK